MFKMLLIILLTVASETVQAQIDDPGLPGGDPDVPLDGGVSLLLLAGAIYGASKIKKAADDRNGHSDQ